MWIGIVLIVLGGLDSGLLRNRVDWSYFILWTILVSLVVSGLIYTFRDKKTPKTKDEQKQ